MAIANSMYLNVETNDKKFLEVRYASNQLSRLAWALRKYNPAVYGKFDLEGLEADLLEDLHRMAVEHSGQLQAPGDYMARGTAGYHIQVCVYANDEPVDKRLRYEAEFLIDPEILFLDVDFTQA